MQSLNYELSNSNLQINGRNLTFTNEWKCSTCIEKCGLECQEFCPHCGESNIKNQSKPLLNWRDPDESLTNLSKSEASLDESWPNLNESWTNSTEISTNWTNTEDAIRNLEESWLDLNESCSQCIFQQDFEETSTTPFPIVNIVIRGDIPEESESVLNHDPKNPESNCMRKICRSRFFGTKKPPEIEPAIESCSDVKSRYIHDLREKIRLRKLCWETMFGQELVKLTVMDTVFTLLSIFIGDFARSLLLR